ncbi:hypothetical protein B4U80_08055, partial [Leptotrombidium deliense]
MYAGSFLFCEPPVLAVGTEVSAKYKGAFCEARIKKVARLVKCRVAFKNAGSSVVTDDNIKGSLHVGAHIEAKHPDKNVYIDGVINKIIDASQYTVVFDDEDEATLRRTSLCLKSGKHFAESESLDHLPLTHPEHFGNPVNPRKPKRKVGGKIGRRKASKLAVKDGDNESNAGDDSRSCDNESADFDNESAGCDNDSALLDDESATGDNKSPICDNEIPGCDNGGGDRNVAFNDNTDSDGESDVTGKTSTVSKDEVVSVSERGRVKPGKQPAKQPSESDSMDQTSVTNPVNPRKYKRKVGGKVGRRKSLKVATKDENDNSGGDNGGGDRNAFDENSETEGESDVNTKTATISKEEVVNVGDRIRVKYGKGKHKKVYEAKILKEDEEADYLRKKYYVHYTGWNIRYDEWIVRNRIVEIVRDKSPKRRGGNKQKNKGVPLNVETGECSEPPAKESKDTKDTSTTVKRGRPQSGSAGKQRASAKNAIRNNGKKDSKLAKRTKTKLEPQESVEKSSTSPDRSVSEEQDSVSIKVDLNTIVETKDDENDENNISEKIEETAQKPISEDELKSNVAVDNDDKLLTCSESLDKSPPPKLFQFDESNTDCESHEDEKVTKACDKDVDEVLVKQEIVEEQSDEKSSKISKRKRKE